MSEYQSSFATVVAQPTNVALIERFLAEHHDESMAWMPATEIRSIRAELRSGQRLHPTKLDATLALVGRSLSVTERTALRDGEADSALRSRTEALLQGAEAVTLRAERHGGIQIAANALSTCGFTVRTMDGPVISGIEARRGHTVLLLAANDGGGWEIDTMGHGGDDCEPLIDEISDRFASVGLDMTIRRRTRHGDRRGGTLITEAAQASSDDLLAGLIASRHTAGPTAPAPRARVAPRGRERA